MLAFLEKYTVGELLISLAIISVAFGDIYKIAGIVPVYLAFLAVAVIFEAGTMFRQKPDTPLHFFALSWILFATFDLALHFDNSNMTIYFSSCANSLFIYLIACTALKKKDVLSLYSKALIACVLITIIACVIETYTGIHYVNFDERYRRMFSSLAAGFQVNINDNATLLSLMIPAVLITMRAKTKYLIAFILLVLVVQIGSRLCNVSIAVLLLLSAGLGLYSKIGDRDSKRTYKVFLICIFGIVAIIMALFLDSIYSALVSLSGESLSTTTADDLFRVDRITDTILLSLNPGFLIGNGPGATLEIIGYSPHCSVFELLSDYGIVVFASLLALSAPFFSAFAKRGGLMNRVLLTAFPVFFLMVSFTSSSMLRIHCVWVILAILFCYAYQQGKPAIEADALSARGKVGSRS